MNERQLIERILAGDAAAERSLYDAHVDRIYRLAYRMTGEQTMAEDCTQETFVRAFENLAEFERRSALSTWLHAIAVSVVLNCLRKVKRLRQREIELDESTVAATASPVANPDLKLRLHRAIDKLADELRLVFVMHDVEGYKHQEIASVLTVPVGTTKSRLSRARQFLREELTQPRLGSAEEEGS